jgi:5-hydroxyisourate hydrolase-like protein (transthyretin family)
MTQNQEDFNAVFGAILCGRCVCGERLWFNGGEVYERLPDCPLDTLIDDTNTWLTENKTRISGALAEYNTFLLSRLYIQHNVYEFLERHTEEYITVKELPKIVEEFREIIPIFVRIRDERDSCHLICMLKRLKCE